MKTFCVVGIRKTSPTQLPEIITKLTHRSLYCITTNIPYEHKWSEKQIQKLFQSEKACSKLLNRLGDSQFINLYDHVDIKELGFDERGYLTIIDL